MPHLDLPAAAPSLADAVVTAVRDGIRARELVPGEVYSVYQLAGLLGVSRTPVREGLLKLAEAGLVEFARNRGFRVVLPRARDVEEIFEVRLALEPAAASRVCETGSDDDVAAIAAHLAALHAASERDDEATFWAEDRALHDRILRAAGNARAAAIVEQLRATTVLLRPPTSATGRSLAQICAEHEPIVAAIRGRDGAAAEAAMRDHLAHTCRLLVGATH